MWSCPVCNRDFINANQYHSCNDKTLKDFLNGKSLHSIELFEHFIREYEMISKVTVHTTKTMITVSCKTGIAYITQVGKNFIDIVFPFNKPFEDNLCFIKIKQVPASNQYNHHFRMCFKDDINEEVKHYMKLAFEKGISSD